MTTGDVILLLPVGAWVIVAALACYGLYCCVTALEPPPAIEGALRPVVIIPVREVPPHFRMLWQAILAQTLPPKRVIFAIETTDDPVCDVIRSLQGPHETVVAGPTTLRAQKVHNQLAALATLTAEDDAIVLADADIVPDADWLARLVVPLNDPQVQLVSGYRWMSPTDGSWWSALVCVCNASIATVPRVPPWNLAWGGSIAMRRATLDELELRENWKNSVLDDLSLTVAIKARGGHVTNLQSLLVPSPTSFTLADGIAFGRRQYLYVRWFAPVNWWIAAGAVTIPLLGWAFALPLALAGSRPAFVGLIAANVLDQVRAMLRRRVPRVLWKQDMPTRMAVLDQFATPVCLAVHAAVIWSTAVGSSLKWAGRVYTLDRRHRVVRVDTQA